MTDLTQTITAMVDALKEKRMSAIEKVVQDLEDELPEAGIALHAILAAKRIQDCATSEKTIAVIVWPEGASLTLEAKGDVNVADLVRTLAKMDGGD